MLLFQIMWIDFQNALVNFSHIDYIIFDNENQVAIYFSSRTEPLILEVGDLKQAKEIFNSWIKNDTTTPSAKS